MVVCLGPLCKAKGALDRKMVSWDSLKYPAEQDRVMNNGARPPSGLRIQ